MARVMRMPGVAADATEAVLSEWLVEESGEFGAADAIATVETEKAAVDVEADTAGRVLKTLVPPGAQVAVGDPIAVLGDPGEQVDDLDALLASLGVAPATDVVVPERRDVPSDPESAAPVAEPFGGRAKSRPPHDRTFASPLARKLAKAAGLGIEEISGTGPRGRILRRDVEAALASRSAPPPVEEGVASVVEERALRASRNHRDLQASYDEIPHSRIRLATARRLTESQQTVPHFYLRATVRAEALLALRTEINEDAATRISVNDLVVKAVAAAHHRVPEMNVTWTPDAVRRYRTADIAIAVATDRGLLTPVVRDVGSLTVTALAANVRDLVERSRGGRLKQDELEGGSISVSNLGMYGVEEFAAIINPPHAAILAVGALREEPVVAAGAVVPATVMSLTLSVDHRPVDGVIAARWLAVLVDLLEHPARALA
ncbi:MAG TPA: dihydrolipoamide acetyltransferase family protein [Nocardioides sp.]|uniref:dihydrolipoamide acetyltransferase family protein n=1 Tax=Nocardioides sp. TaxID=35761 RepID=UPI002F3E6D2A